MGLSLSSLNPVKQFRKGFESITGVSDARAGINAANAAQQAAIRKAIEGLESGGELATSTLKGGQQASMEALQDALGQSQGFLQQGGTGALQALGAGRGASVDALRGANQAAIGTLNPVAGLFDPNALAQNFTQQGFGQQLAGFADPQGAFADIFNQRQQSATNALGAAGLTRSGRAAKEAARIDLETALGLSNTLFDRQRQNPALAAIQNISNLQSGLGGQLAGIETGFGQNQANVLSSLGQNQANLQTGFGQNISGLESALSGDLANLQLGQASNIANLGIGAGASKAQALQAIGGLRGQAAAPFIEGAIDLASSFIKPPTGP